MKSEVLDDENVGVFFHTLVMTKFNIFLAENKFKNSTKCLKLQILIKKKTTSVSSTTTASEDLLSLS